MKVAKIVKVHFYDFSLEPKRMGLINGVLYKGYANGDSVYLVSVVNGLKGVIILCSAKGESFAKYDAEFLSFLASLGYSPSGTKDNTVKNDNAPDASKTKILAGEKGIINSCSYFPAMNGMKFIYKRNDMAGEHRIVESYNVVKDKTLKSGKTIKGYKISTTVANRNNSVIYYYCDNNSMKMYSEMPSYNTHIKEYVEDYSVLPSDYNKPDYQKTPVWETEKVGSGKFLHFTELKAGSTGTEWTDIQVVNGNPVIITSRIVETGLTLTVQGKNYSPVIHVKRTVTIKFQGEDKKLNSQDIYYAKGVGKIKIIEKGNDILMGSFTTTQELVSYNLPESQ